MALDGRRSVNLGLSIKFEAKGLKVIGYSRKANRHWEFSQLTVDLIKEYKVAGSKVLSAGFLNPRLHRKNSLRSWSALKGMQTVNLHSSDEPCEGFNLFGFRFPSVIRRVPRSGLRFQSQGAKGLAR